jgi:prepilin-type N-terminal cleavage/methylation domain-containing protein
MRTMRNKHGFSLVELLTVIAIIAILAAIIFPVMGAVKERAKRVQCMTNLHDIAMALKMFQTDNRRFPVSLAGYVQYDSGNAVIPLERTKGDALYPEYIKSIKGLHCPISNISSTTVVTQVDAGGKQYNYYSYCSYDVYTPTIPTEGMPYNANWLTDVRYTLEWAPEKGAVAAMYTPTSGESDSESLQEYDYKRQLKFRNPPDDTVVTWCSYHRRSGDSKSTIPVLFLDGHADMIPAADVEGSGSGPSTRWRVHPKK